MKRLTEDDIRKMFPMELRIHMNLHPEDGLKISWVFWKSTIYMLWIAFLYRLGIIKDSESGDNAK